MTHFLHPEMFWLLLLPVLFRFLLPAARGLHGDALRIPFLRDIEKISIKSGSVWRQSPPANSGFSPKLALLSFIWLLLVLAAARPQWIGEAVRLPGKSRDILLVVDISTSMLEPDFSLNGRRIDRLSAVKKTASEFMRKRTDDRIGLVLFGSRAYLQAPVTYDKKSVEEILWNAAAGMAGNSTSIGDALGLSLKSLRDNGTPGQKIIILLTDGENNSGALSLPQAVKLARDENVKIYTIGVGSDNAFVNSFFGINLQRTPGLDEKSLQDIARQTEGTYFRAKDTDSLEKIYTRIDKLEAVDHDASYIRETKELFYWPLGAALVLAAVLLLYSRRK